jgi:hypothetical protein
VILVADLVAPAAEAATGVDALGLEAGEELGEDTFTLERRGGVAVVEAAVVGGDDLVFGLDHLGVDETLDGIGEEGVVVDGLVGRFGDFQHDGPVWACLGAGILGLGAVGKLLGGELDGRLRLVVGGVVGEDGGAVEWAVVFGEVELFGQGVSIDVVVKIVSSQISWNTYPALVSNSLRAFTSDTNTNNVGGGEEQSLAEVDQLLVTHLLDKSVHGHGGDQLVVSDSGAILESNGLVIGVHLADLAVVAEASLLLGDSVCNRNPDSTSSSMCGEAESGIGAPVASSLLEDDVLGDGLEVRGGDTLTQPGALHLIRHSLAGMLLLLE